MKMTASQAVAVLGTAGPGPKISAGLLFENDDFPDLFLNFPIYLTRWFLSFLFLSYA